MFIDPSLDVMKNILSIEVYIHFVLKQINHINNINIF